MNIYKLRNMTLNGANDGKKDEEADAMNEQESTFTPSEFSNMCGISKQTLLLYDRIGLLKPWSVDQRGFRRYHNQQYDLVTTIQTLKETGMSLAEIAVIINHRTPQSLIDLFREKLPILQKKIEILQKICQETETRILILDTASKINEDLISIEQLKPELIQCSKCLEGKTRTEVNLAIAEHMKVRRKQNLQIAHSPCSMVKVEGCMERTKNTYSYLYTRMAGNCDRPEFDLKPGGPYLVSYYRGHYSNSYQRHPAMVEYAAQHNLMIGPYFYEESLIDEVASCTPKDYLTRIEIPIMNIAIEKAP